MAIATKKCCSQGSSCTELSSAQSTILSSQSCCCNFVRCPAIVASPAQAPALVWVWLQLGFVLTARRSICSDRPAISDRPLGLACRIFKETCSNVCHVCFALMSNCLKLMPIFSLAKGHSGSYCRALRRICARGDKSARMRWQGTPVWHQFHHPVSCSCCHSLTSLWTDCKSNLSTAAGVLVYSSGYRPLLGL